MHKITTIDSSTGGASHADNNPLHAAPIRTLRANPYQLLLRDESGNTLAHYAVINDNQAHLKACLKLAPSLAFFRNHYGQSPIMLSVLLNKTDLFSHLLEKYPHTLYQRDKYGHTALGFAIEQDKRYFLKIIRYKAPEHLKKRDAADGLSPIFKCIRYGALQCLNYLIEEFPDMLTGTNEAGQTPIEYAAQFSYLPSIYILLRCPQSNHQLVEAMNVAAQHKHASVLRALIDAKPGSLTMKNNNNQSPVTLAILNGDTAALSYYFDRKPGLLSMKVFADDTPGLFAARHDRSDSLAFIKSRHPNLFNEENSEGQNIIDIALENKSISCTRFLLGTAPNSFLHSNQRLGAFWSNHKFYSASYSDIRAQTTLMLWQMIQHTYPSAQPNMVLLEAIPDIILDIEDNLGQVTLTTISTRLIELMAFIHDPSNEAHQRNLYNMTTPYRMVFHVLGTILLGLMFCLSFSLSVSSLICASAYPSLYSAVLAISMNAIFGLVTVGYVWLTSIDIKLNNTISTFKADVGQWATPTVQAKSSNPPSMLDADSDRTGKDESKQAEPTEPRPSRPLV